MTLSSLPGSDPRSTETSPVARRRGSGFIPDVPVTCLRDFFLRDEFRPLLQRGAILLHGKRDYARHTVDLLRDHQKGYIRLKVPEPGWTAEDLIALLPRSRCRTLLITDRPGSHADVIKLLDHRAAARTPRFGVWLVGFVGELTLSEIGLFDAIVAFSMADDEIERLRSAAVLSTDAQAQLRSPDQAFIYVAARPQKTWTFASPELNPCVVPIDSPVADTVRNPMPAWQS
jgi:hypothetical protein